MSKRIIAFLVVFSSLLSFVIIPVFASDDDYSSLDTVSYWEVLLHTGLIGGITDTLDIFFGTSFNETNFVNKVSAGLTSSYCDISDDGWHHCQGKDLYLSGNDVMGKCSLCGKAFDVTDDAVNQLKEAYGAPLGHGMGGTSGGETGGFGYVKKVEDELGTTIVGNDGLILPLYTTSSNARSGTPGFNFVFSLTARGDSILYFSFIGTAPVDGLYRFKYNLSLIDCTLGSSFYVLDSTYTFESGSNLGGGGFVNVPASKSCVVSGRFWFEVTPLSAYNVNTYTANIGGISSRATSFTGDIGIIGDDGQLTKVDGDQIFNETTNNYYNPSTGTTSTVTDWTYDYSDRSYNLTLESGDTVTVTYGDENITIQEGDTVYNVYYIIDGSASSDPCPEGGAHDWQPGETVDATCTVAGFKTETCSKCGEERTTDLPALGHKWKVKQSVQTKYDENGELLQQGYTIYECERCGEQYKSTDSSGPPGGMTPGTGSGSGTGSDSGSGEDDESIWSKLGKFLGTLGDGLIDFVLALIGKVLDWLISLAEFIGDKLVAVAKVILDIFDFLPGLFTGFLTFLESAFGFLPTEIVMILTFGIAAIVFIAIIKAIRR